MIPLRRVGKCVCAVVMQESENGGVKEANV